jgi:hypothetical protein
MQLLVQLLLLPHPKWPCRAVASLWPPSHPGPSPGPAQLLQLRLQSIWGAGMGYSTRGTPGELDQARGDEGQRGHGGQGGDSSQLPASPWPLKSLSSSQAALGAKATGAPGVSRQLPLPRLGTTVRGLGWYWKFVDWLYCLIFLPAEATIFPCLLHYPLAPLSPVPSCWESYLHGKNRFLCPLT